jgi:hypothetical protein
VNDVDPADEISLYPNPTQDRVTIRLNTNSSGHIKLFDSAGKKLFESEAKNQIENIQIDLSKYKAGMYKLVFVTNKGKLIQRSIIKN